jgi:hypothetical protein
VDGEQGVPLNTIVLMRWDDGILGTGGPEQLISVVLRGPDGLPVPAVVTNQGWGSKYMAAIELRPSAPLAPATTYTVAYENDTHPVDQPLHASFTTGSAEDHDAPTGLGEASLSADLVEACEAHSMPNCCYNEVPVRKRDLLVTWPAALGESVVFGVREGDLLLARGVSAELDPLAIGAINCDDAYIDCGFGGLQPFILPPGTHTLTFFAEDRAGNEVVIGQSTVDGSCVSPAPEVDAGLSGDGGPGPAPKDTSGCGCRVGVARPGSGWLAMLALVPILRRRRRQGRASSLTVT